MNLKRGVGGMIDYPCFKMCINICYVRQVIIKHFLHRSDILAAYIKEKNIRNPDFLIFSNLFIFN